MATPFERFFAGEFQSALLRPINEPGLLSGDTPLSSMSWDRRAAYLLWVERGRPSGPSPHSPAVHVPDSDDLESILG